MSDVIGDLVARLRMGIDSVAIPDAERVMHEAADVIELLRMKLAEFENVPVRLRHIMKTGKLPES